MAKMCDNCKGQIAVQGNYIEADGKVSDFIPEGTPWKGDINGAAIQCDIEVKIPDGENVKISQLFTYINDDGKTAYSKSSNLGKYKTKYGKLPEPGDQVKIMSNSEGFGKIKID